MHMCRNEEWIRVYGTDDNIDEKNIQLSWIQRWN